MINRTLFLCCGMMAIASFSSAQEQAAPSVPQPKVFDPKSPPVHDPVMAKDGDTYYVFGTGPGISTLYSKDLKTWQKGDLFSIKTPNG